MSNFFCVTTDVPSRQVGNNLQVATDFTKWIIMNNVTYTNCEEVMMLNSCNE